MLWIADHRVGRQEIYQGNPSHATTPELRNDHKALQMGAYALNRSERRQTNESVRNKAKTFTNEW
jgi:hypothetical protein